MNHRFLNKLYAIVFGYFWIPCPLCGQMFGGHEWKDYDGKYSSIREQRINVDSTFGKAICPDCTKKGFGDMP